MVDVLEAPPFVSDDEPGAGCEPAAVASTRNLTRRRYAPLLGVVFAVGFSAWMLRSELRVLPYPNDGIGHSAMARFAADRMRAGHNPFDAWFPYFGLGVPQFTQYQTLSHILTGLLSLVFGSGTFRVIGYLLTCTWPVSVYAGARLFELDRREASAAALLSPMLTNITGFGFEWSSFVWSGWGTWSMLWAIWLLPIALGLAWHTVAKSERIALATFVVGLICALHFITGYLVLLAFGVFAVMHPPEFIMRLGRSMVVGIGGMLVFAFVFVPTLSGIPYVNVDALGLSPRWRDSYGPEKVLGWLFRGEIFDYGHFPVVSVLVAIGVVVSLQRARRSEAARIPLGLLVLSLLLYSGRSVVGPVINYLPGGTELHLHRYVIGVHMAGLLLAGIGAVGVLQLAATAMRFVRYRRRPALAVAFASAVAVAGMYPLIAARADFAHANSSLMNRQVASDNAELDDVGALIGIAKQRGDGRIYAGGSSSWGMFTLLGQIPLYLYPLQQDADSLGYYFVSNSLSANVEPLFDDGNLAHYDLFNVKYVLVASKQRAPIADARLLARRGNYSLYTVETTGYLEVVDTTKAIKATRADMASVMGPYLKSPAVKELRHPFVSFDASATPDPSIDRSAPFTGPLGSVDRTTVDLADAQFGGTVTASRPAWVMLKESYSPQWTATVDSKPVKTQMLAPSFVGVPVPAGVHSVAFAYKSRSSYPALFAIGALTLLGLSIGPPLWRRRRVTPGR